MIRRACVIWWTAAGNVRTLCDNRLTTCAPQRMVLKTVSAYYFAEVGVERRGLHDGNRLCSQHSTTIGRDRIATATA